MKMSDTGEWFKITFPVKTPATSVVALTNWDSEDVQASYYDCQKYTSNIMRYEDRVFIRSLFLFDDDNKDMYITDTCTTFEAIYENLPIIDTLRNSAEEKRNCGLVIDTEASEFDAVKEGDGVLKIYWKDKSVIYDENKITVVSDKLCFYKGTMNVTVEGNTLIYNCKDIDYSLRIENARVFVLECGDIEIIPKDGKCELYPEKYLKKDKKCESEELRE